MELRTRWTFLSLLCLFVLRVLAQEEEDPYACSLTEPCEIGCCGPPNSLGKSVCGTGPEFCGTGCIGNCHYKAACDPAGWGPQYANATNCPLNVCCSDFGFCGTTELFCKGRTVASPSCPRSAKTSNKRTIGYYEGWHLGQRGCARMTPEEIPLGIYTHIYYSFALIHPTTYRIMHMDEGTAALYDRVTALADRQPDLEVYIAIGGWAMNDEDQPTRWTFSDVAGNLNAQNAFFDSLVTFIKKHNFDGVDIDWEYPVAVERSGRPEDYVNIVTFLENLKNRLHSIGYNRHGKPYGLSITLPASYWYLRHFDIVNIEPHIDYFNMMTYDIHGTWDAGIDALGPYALAHTNLTEIHQALELMWRNNINPDRVLLGLGFYGRSFTMKSPSCLAPGCEYIGGGAPGACTNVEGVLSGYEIREKIQSGATVTYDALAGAKIVTWGGNQWVSYDDAETLAIKVNYANERCLGGTLVWAIDLDPAANEDLLKAMGKPRSRVKREMDMSDIYMGNDLGFKFSDFTPLPEDVV